MVKPTLYQLIGHAGLLQQINTNVRTIISPDISKYAISDVLRLKFGQSSGGGIEFRCSMRSLSTLEKAILFLVCCFYKSSNIVGHCYTSSCNINLSYTFKLKQIIYCWNTNVSSSNLQEQFKSKKNKVRERRWVFFLIL